MTLAEQFKCEIPSPNAVKTETIYCSASSPENYLWLGDLATWITAIATCCLVVGVRYAYKQLKENREMHDDQQQLDALADYITSFQFFEALRAEDEPELIKAITRVRSTGLLFALVFRIQDQLVLGSIRRFEEVLIDFAILEFEMRNSGPYKKDHHSHTRSLSTLASTATEALPRLRQKNFGINDLSELFTNAANKAQSENPGSVLQALVFRGLFARKSQ